MKSKIAILISSLTFSAIISNAGTLAAQALKCGGLISLDTYQYSVVLTVKKVGNSTCEKLEVGSENMSRLLRQDVTSFVLTKELGNQLAAIVNDEVVVLTIANLSTSSHLIEIERQRLALEKQAAARRRAMDNAQAAATGAVIVGATGAAVADEVSRSER